MSPRRVFGLQIQRFQWRHRVALILRGSTPSRMNSPASIEPQTERPTLQGASIRSRTALSAAGVLVAAVVLAWCAHLIQAGRDAERGVLLTACVFGAILAAVPAIYLLRER